jgi:hypothetical protein
VSRDLRPIEGLSANKLLREAKQTDDERYLVRPECILSAEGLIADPEVRRYFGHETWIEQYAASIAVAPSDCIADPLEVASFDCITRLHNRSGWVRRL